MTNDIGSFESLGLIKPILKDVERVAPGYRWCVAGGAVRDLLLSRQPRDYDVFACLEEPLKPAADRILDLFTSAGYLCRQKSTSSYALTAIQMYGVGVEICPVYANNPIQLAKSFDYNVCLAAAWLESGPNVALGPDHVCAWADTAMLDCLRKRAGDLLLLRDTTPDTTLRRGYVFQDRFGLRFRKADQLHLARKLLERNGFDVTLGGAKVEDKPVAGGKLS